MPSRRRLLLLLLVVPLLAIPVAFYSCRGRPPINPNGAPPVVPVQEDPLEVARDMLRKGAELANCQEAVRRLNTYLGRSAADRAKLLDIRDDPEFLDRTVGLTKDEVDYLGGATFLPLDAYHLEQCFLLRDTAEALQLSALPPLRRAELAMDWVARMVALDTSTFLMSPSQFVLRRGRGTPHERALLFLGLLQQLDLPGCLIAVPGEKDEETRLWCVGVVLEGKDKGQHQIHLFEPRLGMPIPGPGGTGVATLAEVKAQPDLLKALGGEDRTKYPIGPEQLKKAEVYLAASLPALAPRLRWLEALVNQRDHVRVSVEASKLLQLLEKAAEGKVKVWNQPLTPKEPTTNSALRCLRQFLPPEEGGTSRIHAQREWQRRLIPMPAVVQQYQALGVWDVPGFGRESQAQLKLFTGQLFTLYSRVPQELLIRGQLEEMPRPLVRIRDELRRVEEAVVDRETEADERRKWLKRAIQANLALNNRQPGGAEAFAAVWTADQYLSALSLGQDQQPGGAPLQRGPLGTLVLTAVADTLGSDAHYLLALCWLEKTRRLEGRLERQQAAGIKDLDSLKRDVKLAWVNALNWLARAGERLPLQVGSLGHRLQPLQQVWQLPMLDPLGERDDLELGLWGVLLADVQRAAHVRLLHADGLLRTGQRDPALAEFKRLGDELTALLDAGEIRELLKLSQQRVGELRPPLNELTRVRFEHATAPLAADGSLSWLLRVARYRAKG